MLVNGLEAFDGTNVKVDFKLGNEACENIGGGILGIVEEMGGSV